MQMQLPKIELRGWRKYSIALLSLIFSFVGLMSNKIDGNIFFNCIVAILGLYGAANFANHQASAKADEKHQTAKETLE
jgi:hypothetical protein